MNDWFSRFARAVADLCGKSSAFVVVCAAIVLWLASGPFFNYSDTWQLFINTATTLVTTIMVFVLQHTQNRDTVAMQLKLDELIRTSQASDRMEGIEDLTDSELQMIKAHRRQTNE